MKIQCSQKKEEYSCQVTELVSLINIDFSTMIQVCSKPLVLKVWLPYQLNYYLGTC